MTGAGIWLLSAAWIAASAASPWAQKALSIIDPTIVSLLLFFFVVGVLGIPLGVVLGRVGAVRKAVITATLGTAAATAGCVAQSWGLGVKLSPGGAAFVALLVFLFVIPAVLFPSVAFVIAWSLRKR
ncbi:hypothetical protein [Streptomyces sp. NPDC048361]|uniref:hypothetical protein n=1 Tax=Streptomyces sp. NPDC048361 TaxID=3154720 RepID=UPI00342B5B25